MSSLNSQLYIFLDDIIPRFEISQVAGSTQSLIKNILQKIDENTNELFIIDHNGLEINDISQIQNSKFICLIKKRSSLSFGMKDIDNKERTYINQISEENINKNEIDLSNFISNTNCLTQNNIIFSKLKSQKDEILQLKSETKQLLEIKEVALEELKLREMDIEILKKQVKTYEEEASDLQKLLNFYRAKVAFSEKQRQINEKDIDNFKVKTTEIIKEESSIITKEQINLQEINPPRELKISRNKIPETTYNFKGNTFRRIELLNKPLMDDEIENEEKIVFISPLLDIEKNHCDGNLNEGIIDYPINSNQINLINHNEQDKNKILNTRKKNVFGKMIYTQRSQLQNEKSDSRYSPDIHYDSPNGDGSKMIELDMELVKIQKLIKSLENDNYELGTTINEIKEEKKNILSELGKKELEIKVLTEQKVEIENQKRHLENKIIELTKELNDMKISSETFTNEMIKKQENIENEKNDLILACQFKDQQINQLSKQYETLQNRLNDFNCKIGISFHDTGSPANSTNSQTFEDHTKSSISNEDLCSKLKDKENELEQARKDHEQTKNEIKRLKEQLALLLKRLSKISTFSLSRSKLFDEKAIGSKFQDCSESINHKTNSYPKQNEDIQIKSDKINHIIKDEEYISQLKTMEEEIKEYVKRNDELTTDKILLRTKITRLTERIFLMEQAMEALKQENIKLLKLCRVLDAKIQEPKLDISNLNSNDATNKSKMIIDGINLLQSNPIDSPNYIATEINQDNLKTSELLPRNNKDEINYKNLYIELTKKITGVLDEFNNSSNFRIVTPNRQDDPFEMLELIQIFMKPILKKMGQQQGSGSGPQIGEDMLFIRYPNDEYMLAITEYDGRRIYIITSYPKKPLKNLASIEDKFFIYKGKVAARAKKITEDDPLKYKIVQELKFNKDDRVYWIEIDELVPMSVEARHWIRNGSYNLNNSLNFSDKDSRKFLKMRDLFRSSRDSDSISLKTFGLNPKKSKFYDQSLYSGSMQIQEEDPMKIRDNEEEEKISSKEESYKNENNKQAKIQNSLKKINFMLYPIANLTTE